VVDELTPDHQPQRLCVVCYVAIFSDQWTDETSWR